MTANAVKNDQKKLHQKPTDQQVSVYARRESELRKRFLKGLLDTNGVLDLLQKALELVKGFINCNTQPEIPDWADKNKPIIEHALCGTIDPSRFSTAIVFKDGDGDVLEGEDFIARAQKLPGAMNACALDFYVLHQAEELEVSSEGCRCHRFPQNDLPRLEQRPLCAVSLPSWCGVAPELRLARRRVLSSRSGGRARKWFPVLDLLVLQQPQQPQGLTLGESCTSSPPSPLVRFAGGGVFNSWPRPIAAKTGARWRKFESLKPRPSYVSLSLTRPLIRDTFIAVVFAVLNTNNQPLKGRVMNAKNLSNSFITFTLITLNQYLVQAMEKIAGCLRTMGHTVNTFTPDQQAGSGWRQVQPAIANSDMMVLFSHIDGLGDARMGAYSNLVRAHNCTYVVLVGSGDVSLVPNSHDFDDVVDLCRLCPNGTVVRGEVEKLLCNLAQYQ